LIRAQDTDRVELRLFLRSVDLTLSGLDDPELALWVRVDSDGRIEGTAGFELAGRNALIRSVAVAAPARGTGLGRQLALFALDRAAEAGAERAWLFSRRSGPFWQKLDFESADRDELAQLLSTTHQVAEFVATGQLGREIAWSRGLAQRP
jgi:N-acetylglutamate synthase-like GNAT family acetyltransferase